MKNLFRFLQFVAQCITLGLACAFLVSLFAPQWVERLRGSSATAPVAREEAPAESTATAKLNAGIDFGPAAAIRGPYAANETDTTLTSYAKAVTEAAPGVVSIKVNKIETKLVPTLYTPRDPRLREIIGVVPGPPKQQDVPTPGLGSGVIINSDGYVLTNYHVIKGATDISAIFQDGRTKAVTLVGSDDETDLAVLHLDAYDTPHVQIAQTPPRVGDVVLAIGSPFGLGNTVTMGIVSGLGRQLTPTAEEDFIQTDAAINEGNSGGALVNARGELIGINSNSYSPSGAAGNIGIGFAIPVGIAKKVLDQIVKNGHVVRAWMGADYKDSQSTQNDPMPVVTNGALIVDIKADGPAAKAGILVGDVVTRFDGHWIPNQFALRNRESHMAPGTQVALSVLRNGNPLDFNLVLAEKPTPAQAQAATSAPQ